MIKIKKVTLICCYYLILEAHSNFTICPTYVLFLVQNHMLSFNNHVPFSLGQILNLSLSFMTLTLLKSTSQLFVERWVSLVPHDYILIFHDGTSSMHIFEGMSCQTVPLPRTLVAAFVQASVTLLIALVWINVPQRHMCRKAWSPACDTVGRRWSL